MAQQLSTTLRNNSAQLVIEPEQLQLKRKVRQKQQKPVTQEDDLLDDEGLKAIAQLIWG